jgi:NADPH2:quinone reductase
VIPARQASPLAKDLTLEQAATFFVNPATAYIMTRKILRIPKGEWLLQTASGSALGGMVIRLAQRFGFRTINIVRRNEQIEEIKEIGGHAVIHFDPSEHDSRYLREAIQSETGQPGVRFAIDPVSGATGSAVIDCLGEKGRLLVFGTLADEPLSFSSRTLMTVEARIEGFWLARWMAEQSILSKLKLVKSITRLMREGVLVSEVGSTFPLTEISEAVRTAETVGRGGKVLLEISRT